MQVDAQNKEGKRRGLVTTVIFHLALLIICFFFGFSYKVPPEGDVAIGFESLGTETGGKNQAIATSEKVAPKPQEEQVAPVSSASQEEELFATQDESPVSVSKQDPTKNKQNNANPSKTDETNAQKEKPREVDESLKDLGSLLQGPDQSGGAGTQGGPGNEGSARGVPAGTGQGGSGERGMFDLDGRKAKKPGDLTHECGVQGSIRVRVRVDQNGSVVGAQVVSGPGTTSFNGCLRQKAEEAAKATKYTPNASGPAIQEGYIVLTFSIK